ncbi:hypothetical protein EQG49_05325 [Periweissella cryptocerci]|uniref:Uncharacterized protein n=1 Tax=Periweissella cryptocerci TaxID=2506420 RepID=A0A4P6YTB3_9LACO|nr:hypothetical protein [Periweissella cryptocerci]QBO35920.1 hypothetical protein EQG49_05325 [Periweissella cryptocerci]
MAKQSMASIQRFATNLQTVVDTTEETGNNVAPFYEKLATALEADKLADMPKAEFQEIAAEFNDATEVYEANAGRLNGAQAPIKMIGMYSNLKKHYAAYAQACRAMTDSLNVAEQTVDVEAFNAAGSAQEEEMDKVSATIQKMMGQANF